jgi:hypothetical protein
MIHHGGHAVVRTDFEKFVFELIAPGNIAGDKVIGQATFLQEDSHLFAVGSRPVM